MRSVVTTGNEEYDRVRSRYGRERASHKEEEY
jgi:hypothetical protein